MTIGVSPRMRDALRTICAWPVTVPPGATVAAALSAMRRGRFRHLPVVAAAELVGVVSSNDLEASPGAPVEAAESLGDRPVAEVMTGQPVTVWPDEPVEVAARLLVEHAIGCLPVVADEGLVAILGVPLRLGPSVIGVLFAANRTERPFAREEVALLVSLGAHAAVAIDAARLLTETQAALAELSAAVDRTVSAMPPERDEHGKREPQPGGGADQ